MFFEWREGYAELVVANFALVPHCPSHTQTQNPVVPHCPVPALKAYDLFYCLANPLNLGQQVSSISAVVAYDALSVQLGEADLQWLGMCFYIVLPPFHETCLKFV
jgi:hypothetical protein